VAFNDWVEFVMLWFAVEFVRLMDSIVVVFSVLDVDDEVVVLAVVVAFVMPALLEFCCWNRTGLGCMPVRITNGRARSSIIAAMEK
jgi:hypothetical protein